MYKTSLTIGDLVTRGPDWKVKGNLSEAKSISPLHGEDCVDSKTILPGRKGKTVADQNISGGGQPFFATAAASGDEAFELGHALVPYKGEGGAVANALWFDGEKKSTCSGAGYKVWHRTRGSMGSLNGGASVAAYV